MAYAILQTDLKQPELSQLQRAFTVSPELTGYDAVTVFKDAYGILFRGLDNERAKVLCNALIQQEVDAIVVAEAELPALPPARIIRGIEVQPGQWTLLDPMQRSCVLTSPEIMFLAAGRVRVLEFKRIKNHGEEPSFKGAGIGQDTISGVRSKEELHDQLMLEIVLAGGLRRYSLLAHEVDFAFLSERRHTSLAVNFAMLVRDLVEFAPHAGLNRGALQVTQSVSDWLQYPSKAAFFEEVTWMLWRIQRMRQEGQYHI